MSAQARAYHASRLARIPTRVFHGGGVKEQSTQFLRFTFMHALAGFALGAVGSIPAGDVVVTLYLSALFAVGSGITGFILDQVQNAE